jgi:hypothetical protein
MLLDEKEYMVVGSKTMSREEYIEASVWRWMFMFGHFLGFTQHIARILKLTNNITYREFYEKFYKFMKDNPSSFFGNELVDVKNTITKILNFLKTNFEIEDSLLDDVIKFQKLILKSPYKNYPIQETFNYNLNDVVYKSKPIKNGGHTYEFQSENYNGDVRDWAQKNIWWGRRNRAYETKVYEKISN